jgi:hypothetical protein
VAFDNLDVAALSILCAFFQSLTALRIRIACKMEGDRDVVGANETVRFQIHGHFLLLS